MTPNSGFCSISIYIRRCGRRRFKTSINEIATDHILPVMIQLANAESANAESANAKSANAESANAESANAEAVNAESLQTPNQ